MQLDLNDLPSDTVLLHRLVRTQFGRRSERIDADQLALGLEDV
jgi:transposase